MVGMARVTPRVVKITMLEGSGRRAVRCTARVKSNEWDDSHRSGALVLYLSCSCGVLVCSSGAHVTLVMGRSSSELLQYSRIPTTSSTVL